MPRNQSYLDLIIRRQAILERLKTSEANTFLSSFQQIERLIRRTLRELNGEINELNLRELNNLIRLLSRDQAAIFRATTDRFLNTLSEISALNFAQETLDLNNSIDLSETELKSFTNIQVFQRVSCRPLSTNGDLLEPFVRLFSTTEIARVSRAIRLGHSQGQTNQELTRRLVGTRSRNFRDGITSVSRRHASTIVRTSVQHVASSARQELWEANRDIIRRYRFISTLDSTTSAICRTLDRQEFDFGKGPIPPVHPNCRSTTIPILDSKFDFLDEGSTRSSQDGPVNADQTYYGWLRNQDAETQNAVLGRDRANLFRNGGLTAERFRELQFDRNFQPLTLEQMREIEPEAFELAGI